MPSSGMWRCVGLVRTDVLEKRVYFIFNKERIRELGVKSAVCCLLVTANFVPSSLIRSTLKMEATRSYEKSVLTRPTQRYIP
jgi:hypothetical protein